MTLEICANSLQSALTAQEAGAQRVELCENLKEGGTTPSYGQISMARKLLTIKLYVLIRPRAGDFLYSELEFEIMKVDILNCKRLGCDGIVIGLLHSNGQIDVERTKELVALAAPMGVTFHRAFDACIDQEIALEDIIKTGCERILTSGGENTALEGVDAIKHFISQAKSRIIIMPGTGLNAKNIQEMKEKSGAKEFHASAKALQSSSMDYYNPALEYMGDGLMTSNAAEIQKILRRLGRE